MIKINYDNLLSRRDKHYHTFISHVLNVSIPISPPQFHHHSNSNSFNWLNFSKDCVFPSKAGHLVSSRVLTTAVDNLTQNTTSFTNTCMNILIKP